MASVAKLSLGIIDKVLDHFPNFSQDKKKKYRKHRTAYLEEKAKPRKFRNSERMYTERMGYKSILETYYNELNQ